MNRRNFLLGLAAGLAQAVIRTPGLLMPVKAIVPIISGGPSQSVLDAMRGMEIARQEIDEMCGTMIFGDPKRFGSIIYAGIKDWRGVYRIPGV